MRFLRPAGRFLAAFLGWALCAYLALGVWSWAPGGRATQILAALSVFLVTWVWGFQRPQRWRFWVGRGVLVLGLVALLLPQPGGDERVWTPEHAGHLEVFANDGRLTVRGIRQFRWRTAEEYDPIWISRTINLDTVDAVWLAVEPFAPNSPLAHVLLSFSYRDERDAQRFLAISVEARREISEAYNPVAGCFRRYELTYVVGEESDLIGLRAIQRGADVRLYRTTATPEQARQLLQDMLERAQHLQDQPEFYHSVWQNCAGAIAGHLRSRWPGSVPWPEWRLLATAQLAPAARDGGLISGDIDDPRHAISARARVAGSERGDFSTVIRQGLSEP